jgi:hypothetical protein
MVIIVQKAVKNKVNFVQGYGMTLHTFLGAYFLRKTYSYESKVLTLDPQVFEQDNGLSYATFLYFRDSVGSSLASSLATICFLDWSKFNKFSFIIET